MRALSLAAHRVFVPGMEMSDQFDPYHVWLGIPPEDQPPNHYRLLGLRLFEPNPDVISNAVDQRRVYLRSVQAGKRAVQSQQLLNEISAAGVLLLDRAKRSRYDDELRKKLAVPTSAAAPRQRAGEVLDPMAPLAISDLLPQKPKGPTPVVRTVSVPKAGASAVADPVKKEAVQSRAPCQADGSTKAASPTQIAAIVLGGAAILLVAIAGGVWWLVAARSSSGSAESPRVATQAPTLPPQLPPLPPPSLPPEPSIQAKRSVLAGENSPGETFNRPSPPIAPSLTPAPTFPPIAALPQAPPVVPAASPTPLKQPAQNSRQPVPASEALAKGEGTAREVYATEFKDAVTKPQQILLAQRILNTARTTQGDWTSRFVLFDLARTLFMQAGEVSEALIVARILETEYDIPRDQLAARTIKALDSVQVSPEHRLLLARTAAGIADSAVDAEDFDRADELSSFSVQVAAKLRDADQKKEFTAHRAKIMRVVKEWNAIKPSLEKLATDASDTAANLAVGKYYCFSREDFQKGLSYLANSGDTLLADAAQKDLAASAGAESQKFAAAEAWRQAELKIIDREDKLAAQRRERALLQQVVSGLTGLDQIKANKRLVELQGVGAPGTAPTMPAKGKKKKPGTTKVSGAAKPSAVQSTV